MAKKSKRNPGYSAPANNAAVAAGPAPAPVNPAIKFPEWLYSFKAQAFVIAILALIGYTNTVSNVAALDDNMVITQNAYVFKGLDGIPDILGKDSYYSYASQFNSANTLAGGRYRPLSIITFAVEQQFFGTVRDGEMDSFMNHSGSVEAQEKWDVKFAEQMHTRHFFNVLWFTLSVVVLLYFFRTILFRDNPLMAFIAAIIFTVHPIHTEVVANVKSRDEIMSLLFICLTFIYSFRYNREKKKWLLALGLLSYFLAFLSKEYAITLLILLPLAFTLFDGLPLRKSIIAAVPYFGVALVYLFIRLHAVSQAGESAGNELLNNPYLLATGAQKIATELATPLHYLRLLLFPYPLSADYSYNAIPYKEFSAPAVWLSLLVHAGMVYGFFYFYKRSSILSFAIAFYLLPLLLVCNLFFDIGATMGERLIYHSSVGFVIAAAFLIYKAVERIKRGTTARLALAAFMGLLVMLGVYETILRNMDWKDEFTLFSHDLEVVPNSALVNGNVAAALIDKADAEKDEKTKKEDLYRGIALANTAISIHNTYVTAYLNKGLAYFKLMQPDSVMANLNMIKSINPNHPILPEMYYQLGRMYYGGKRYDSAGAAWRHTLECNPDEMRARQALKLLR
jgi:tetratricopeptide (TPR) repeat protein